MRSVGDCAVKWWEKAFEELKRVKIIYHLYFARFSLKNQVVKLTKIKKNHLNTREISKIQVIVIYLLRREFRQN